MNVANTITVLRIILIIPFIILLESSAPNSKYIACALFFILSVSDFIDGYVARKRKETTTIGAMLDPLADKLLVSAALIFLIGASAQNTAGAPAWMVYTILARELIITGLRSVASEKRRSIPAKFSGKLKTFSQMIAIGALILAVPYSYYYILAATIVTVYSGLEYLWLERRLLKELF